MKANDVIAAGGEDTVTVTVSYNDVENPPTLAADRTANITVTLNFVQANGAAATTTNNTPASSFDPVTGNGTVYRWATTSWFNSGTTASGKTATDISTKILGTDYVTNSSDLNKTHYLKYTVTNNIITESYVCFVSDSEHCMKGFDASEFANNTAIVQSYKTYSNLSDVSNPSESNPGCTFNSSISSCWGGAFNLVGAASSGYVSVYISSYSNCTVETSGRSRCEEY